MSEASPIRFGLHWAGKAEARARAHTPAVTTLRPQVAESLAFDDTGHVVIEGDNLEALKLLRRSLAGRVRLVFIDPPYNTGQAFVYPDRYVDGVGAATALERLEGPEAALAEVDDAIAAEGPDPSLERRRDRLRSGG